MSFIPSKLGLRTHPLTQINLALVRVAGGEMCTACCSPVQPKLRRFSLSRTVKITKDALFSCSGARWRAVPRASYLAENEVMLIPWLSPQEVAVPGLSSYSCWPAEGPPAPSGNTPVFSESHCVVALMDRRQS